MPMQIPLSFEDVFPDEERLAPEKYLEGYGKEWVLKSAALFASFRGTDPKNYGFKAAAEKIFGPENNRYANNLYKRVQVVERSTPRVFYNQISSLSLIEIGLQLESEANIKDESLFEKAVFKAYLSLNSLYLEKQEKGLKRLEYNKDYPKAAIAFFCTAYPDNDKINFRLDETFLVQCMKAMYLFNFLESNDQTKPLLQSFLSYFNTTSWREYLKLYLPVAMSILKKENPETHTILNLDPTHADYERDNDFLNRIALPVEEYTPGLDFIPIRSNPTLKIEENQLLILYDLFVIEKIFKGMYFQLNQLNSKLAKKDRIKEFRSFYGHKFSEQELLYQTMKPLYTNSTIRYTGEEIDSKGITAAPDYYIRQGKNILLFESKDFLIDAEVKLSSNLDLYEEAFEKKLFYDFEAENPKAVVQLCGFIKRILKSSFTLDQDYKYREANIYPIIITHDFQYDTPGLDVMINTWLQEELEDMAREGYYTRKVKPLAIINIDTLILHSIPLSSNVPLHQVIDAYHDHQKKIPKRKFKSQEQLNSFVLDKYKPFAYFVTDYMREKGWYELPSIKDQVGKPLFDI